MTNDYLQELINAEGSMVAALYFNLRNELPKEGWAIFAECAVFSPVEGGATGEGRIRVDLVVAHGGEIVAAVECKFTPRGAPGASTIEKDLTSLSLLRRRRAINDSVKIEMVRHHVNRTDEPNARRYKMAANAVRIFAVIGWHQSIHTLLTSTTQGLWDRGAPSSGCWAGFTGDRWPPNFAVMAGRAGPEPSTCLPTFHGLHFERAGLTSVGPMTSN